MTFARITTQEFARRSRVISGPKFVMRVGVAGRQHR